MKNLLFISLLLLIISCSKDDSKNTVNVQDFVGTWICTRSQSSFQIKIGPGPTATSFSEIPAPGYTTSNKYYVTSSSLNGNKLFFIAHLENPFGTDAITEITCTLVDKNTITALQVIKHDNVIKGSAELIYKRKT